MSMLAKSKSELSTKHYSKYESIADAVDSKWKGLYQAGGWIAIVLVAIILIQGAISMISPQPLEGTAIDWFKIFQNNGLLGLLSFEFLMVIYMILSLVIALALYIILRNTQRSLMAIYLALSFIGVMAFIAARPSFEMLSLSNQYTAATTDAQRAMFLSSGQSMVAMFHGTAFQVSYILGSITGFIISVVMLRSNIFSKKIAYIRIASSVFDFGLFVPGIGMYISLFSVLFLLIWNILIARRLFRLGKGVMSENQNLTKIGALGN